MQSPLAHIRRIALTEKSATSICLLKVLCREWGIEPVFAPRAGSWEEGDGWVLVFAYDGARDRSDLVILDAKRIAASPVAVVHLPVRVPAGLHGNWFPAE